MFDDIREEVLTIMEAGLKSDQTFSVGMMVRVEEFAEEYKDTSHTYILSLLEDIRQKLAVIFEKFVVSSPPMFFSSEVVDSLIIG